MGLWVLLSLSAVAQSQKGRAAKQATSRQAATETVGVVSPEIERLMGAYRYEEAIEQLQKDITTAKRKKISTLSLEAELQRAYLGNTMLEATEKVSFIDSFSVSKDSFLKVLRLSRSVGRVGMLEELFKNNTLPALKRGGRTFFLNEFADRAYFSLPDSAGCLKLHASFRLGPSWTKPEILKGFSGEAGCENADFPFLLADGVTMYYAAQGEGSLGGYDIFVTRYHSDSQSFVKPENIGMPFNSPFNDYLYLIDEEAGIGWFVSDRYQPVDKVCVYTFIPNESRETYDYTESTKEAVRQAARLQPFASSRATAQQRDEAHRRLQSITAPDATEATGSPLFIISDTRVYTSLSQFRNASARLIASQWLKAKQKLQALQDRLQVMRREYADKNGGSDLRESILSVENEVEELQQSVATLAKNMRAAELSDK